MHQGSALRKRELIRTPEEARIDALTEGIDRAFTDADLYFRNFYWERLWEMKWTRAAILQSGRG